MSFGNVILGFVGLFFGIIGSIYIHVVPGTVWGFIFMGIASFIMSILVAKIVSIGSKADKKKE